MYRIALMICCIVLSVCAYAQKTAKEYFDKAGKPCEQEYAHTYRLFTKDDDGCLVTDNTIEGRMFMTGHIESFERRKLPEVWTGRFTHYWRNGKKSKEGLMLHGALDGKWMFYNENGSRRKDVIYIKGVVQYEQYYRRNTALVSSEHFYSNGQEDSSWNYEYNDDESLRKINKQVKGHYKAIRCFDKAGNVIPCAADDTGHMVYQFVEQMPAPAYDILKFLSENITYPDSARIYGISGRVLVKFLVNEDGSISDASIAKGVNPLIDSAAIKVVRYMPKWRPGKQNGKPVKVIYTQPINFKLDNDVPANAQKKQ